jgi:transcriptional regulator with XRE-family HTH domain/predicted nucleic acid-binding protein
MGKSLNIPLLKETLAEKGLSQTLLADELGLTRAAVSKWLTGRAFPRPAELLRLGKLLGLGFKQLVAAEQQVIEPLVAFRKRASTVTTTEHQDRAKEMGRLLTPVVQFLPFDQFEAPNRLKQPQLEYDYLQELVTKVRLELEIDPAKRIDFKDLITKFKDLQAVIIPVMWGRKTRHENALHIYLPESRTTWIFLNLDSELHDFKFWMAHELGHVMSVSLLESGDTETAEDFADAFAGALLFPEAAAVEVYAGYSRKKSDSARIQEVIDAARNYLISPFSVYKEVQAHANARKLPFIELPMDAFHAAISNFNKGFKTISENLFDGEVPSADHFMRVTGETFATPVFKALGDYVKKTEIEPSVISRMLDIPLVDAREMSKALA